jgi:hypothetical protein
MNRILASLLAIVFVILSVGCATPYTVRLKDGSVITTKDEPKAEKGTGFYVFEDAKDGKQVRVNKDEIVEIRQN